MAAQDARELPITTRDILIPTTWRERGPHAPLRQALPPRFLELRHDHVGRQLMSHLGWVIDGVGLEVEGEEGVSWSRG